MTKREIVNDILDYFCFTGVKRKKYGRRLLRLTKQVLFEKYDELLLTRKLHNIKILQAYYFGILDGDKTFEFRFNDRNYKKGDFVHFKIVLPNGKILPKFDDCVYEITYILDCGILFEKMSAYCIFSIKERKDLFFNFDTEKVEKRRS